MDHKNCCFNKITEYLYILIYSLLLYPAVLKFSNIFYVDLRFQEIIFLTPPSYYTKFFALGITLISVTSLREFAKRSQASLKSSFIANIPLAGCGAMWFLTPTFPLLVLNIFLAAWSVGRMVSLCRFDNIKELDKKNALLILTAAVLVYAAIGTFQQYNSLNTLALSWFDWGHFYECLNNFFHGKPFHLNLCGGSFLGARFTPTLTLLLPIVATHSLGLFFFTGSLLVASGAFFIYLTARHLKMSVNESLMWSIWYLFIPGVANMNLSLREGFHEVFMLFPLIPAAVWCAATKKHITAAVLVLLILGVRETTGILVAGYGILLLLNRQTKFGISLIAAGTIYVVIAMKVLMPLFDPPIEGTYAHVGFYSHLGQDITEIALSPIQKPAVFWGALFNRRTILFWCTLFLPFAALIYKNPIWLLPALPELLMVSVDRRFDSQTILRHYQISILIVLIISALYGAKKWSETSKPGLLFYGLKSANNYRGSIAFALAATICSFIFFVRYPGLPASEPQRRNFNNGSVTQLSDARRAVSRFKSLIPKGSKVTAGPMIASALVPDYDIHFKFDNNEKTLQDYVLIENFSSFYFPEDQLSRYLLTSPTWELLHQEYVDERSFQLFKRAEKPVVKKAPVLKLDQKTWQNAGQLIPLTLTDIELRAVPVGRNHLRIGARIKQKRAYDVGFKTTLAFADGTQMIHFTSFCNGRYPADLANPGDTFFYIIETPADQKVTACRINVVELKSQTTPL